MSQQQAFPPSQQFQLPANPQVPSPSAQDIFNFFIQEAQEAQPRTNPPGDYRDDNRNYRNYRNDSPVVQQPVPRQVPSEDDLARKSDGDLHKLMQSAESGLRQQLPADWQKYLQLAALSPDFAAGPNGVSADAHQRLRQLADRLDKVTTNPAYHSIFDRWDFQVLQRALHIYLLPPLERSHRQLLAHSKALESQLGRLRGGDGWIRHLEVQQTIASSPQSLNPTWLQTVRQRYETVQQDPKYSLIARLPDFAPTQNALAQTLEHLPASRDTAGQPSTGLEFVKASVQSEGRSLPTRTMRFYVAR